MSLPGPIDDALAFPMPNAFARLLVLALLGPGCGRPSDTDRGAPATSIAAPKPERVTSKPNQDAPATSASTAPSASVSVSASAAVEPPERMEESWVFALYDLHTYRSHPTPTRVTKPSKATNGLAIFEYRLPEIGAVIRRAGDDDRWDLTIQDKPLDAFRTKEPPEPLSGPDKEQWWIIRSGRFTDAFVRQRGKELTFMSPGLACPPFVRTEEYKEACRSAGMAHD